ncbi:MAG: hypothetical protein SGJ00_11915 [bacterium]|nr:hypothetical protein [bacterium]
MLTACPHCDSMVPMNVDLATKSALASLVCACCDKSFDPFGDEIGHIELSIEAIKDELVINKSLQNKGRFFDDC